MIPICSCNLALSAIFAVATLCCIPSVSASYSMRDMAKTRQ